MMPQYRLAHLNNAPTTLCREIADGSAKAPSTVLDAIYALAVTACIA
jgi:hypothetical protein